MPFLVGSLFCYLGGFDKYDLLIYNHKISEEQMLRLQILEKQLKKLRK